MQSKTIPDFELLIDLPAGSGPTRAAKANRDALVSAYHARVRGDAQPLLDLLDPSIMFYEPECLPYGCAYKGLDGVIKGIAEMFSAWQRMRVEFKDFLAAGDIVIAYLQMTGVAKATGGTYDAPGCAIYRFRDGKIVEWRTMYWDTHLVRELCGIN